MELRKVAWIWLALAVGVIATGNDPSILLIGAIVFEAAHRVVLELRNR